MAAQESEEAAPKRSLDVPLILLRIVIAAVAFLVVRSGPVHEDEVIRFEEIAAEPGRPYRDFAVEYAPLELIAIELIGGGGPVQTATVLTGVALASDLAIFGMLKTVWGKHVGTTYLVLGAPVLPLLYLRFDIISVLLATFSIVLLRKGRDGPSGAVMALAALSKVWPLVLVPIFVVERRWRALASFAAVLAIGVILWVAYGTSDALRQVATFRGSSGWQLGSTIGVLVWLVTGQTPHLQQGARRVGSVPGWAPTVLLVAIVAIVGAVWRRARARAVSPEGVPALAAVTTLIVLSPLFSLQYIAWLLPWAAIARADEDGARYTWTCFAAAVLTCALWAIDRTEQSPSQALTLVTQGMIVSRNGLLILLVGWWLGLARSSRRSGDPGSRRRMWAA